MSETLPPPGADRADDDRLFLKASSAAEGTIRDQEARVGRAARSLDGHALAFRYGMTPALVIVGVVILTATSDRTAGLVILTLGMGVVAALFMASLLKGFAALLRVRADEAESFARIERNLAEGLDRIARAVEAAPAVPSSAAAPTAAEFKVSHQAEIRRAIRGGNWEEARSLVQTFADGHPDDPEAGRLADELTEARRVALGEHLARIEAAREANDPDRVIELRDEVRPLIDAEALRALDRDLAKWLIMTVHRRLRAGTARADVAALAGRVAETFDETPEGASLRASLPTLRRAAGLCARCAQPYTGIADACPACLKGAHAPTPATAPTPTDPDQDGLS